MTVDGKRVGAGGIAGTGATDPIPPGFLAALIGRLPAQ